MHGGLSPDLLNVAEMPDTRPCNVGNSGIVCDFLWSDPNERWPAAPHPWLRNDMRNVSYYFSESALDDFLVANDFDLVCRAHQVCEAGYKFFPDGDTRKLVTVFSASGYTGEFANRGGMMIVDGSMRCSFLTFVPPNSTQKQLINVIKDATHSGSQGKH
jgi:serine/threonine-protein phosphatase PP1 catalytic subunit